MDEPAGGSLRRATWWWIRPVVVLGIAVLFLGGLLGALREKVEAVSVCPDCRSRKDSKAWGFGAPFPFSLSWTVSRNSSITPSLTLKEVFQGSCSHRWPIRKYVVTGLFKHQVPVDPDLVAADNPVPEAYERSPRFRAGVAKGIAAGTLTNAALRDLCRQPSHLNTGQKADPKVRALVTQGADLLREAGETPPPDW